ncbi:MAG TPA: molybdopterin-dependent oxidoreductase [Candidatus Methylomirabilis sp.]|nr:molybdopterin-dependent oxidoreductase [Candidatus Methylomirabilis sp.]
MPTLKINGIEVTVPAQTTIIEAANAAGIEIPRYCYHPGLSVVGQCRMCQVEVEKMPKLAIACNTAVADGMVVSTNSPKVEKARRAVLEFYLLNHPLDCPICDKGGECPLQDYTLTYGPGESRSVEEKVKRVKHRVLGPHIVFDAERCILCTRCVRFCNEIPKTGELGVFSRGDRSEINLFPKKVLDNAYSGNVIDLCPVGALTSREYRFRSRPWDLVRHTDSVCPLCSAGCNVILDVRHRQRGAELLRIRPRENPAVNRWWMCDEGRFTFSYLQDPKRLRVPLWRENDRQVEVGWEDLLHRLSRAVRRVALRPGEAVVGCIVSSRHTNEELFLIRRFFREILRTPHLDFRVRPLQFQDADAAEDGILRRSDKTANSRGARDLSILPGRDGLDTLGMIAAAAEGRLKALFVFEEDLVRELPDRQVRNALGKLDLLVTSSLFPTETTALAHVVLPALGFAEKEGSFTNHQGRIQKIHSALTPPGTSRSLPEVLRDLAGELDWDLGDIEPERVWAAIGDMPGPYQGIGWREWKEIGPLGLLPGEQRGK